jgi:methionyl-tRNA formyltransferase
LIGMDSAAETVQDDSLATFAPKVDRAVTRVDWAGSAADVARTIRAYDPKPGALSTVNGGEVKLFGARLAPSTTNAAPGEVLQIDDAGMVVACGTGAVAISRVHPAGKKRITPVEWSRGRGISLGERLS